jgi:hypothetical protein
MNLKRNNKKHKRCIKYKKKKYKRCIKYKKKKFNGCTIGTNTDDEIMQKNFYYFKKTITEPKNLWKSIKMNFKFYIVLLLCILYISYTKKTSLFKIIITIIITSIIGYFIHLICHKISYTNMYNSNKNYITENKVLNKIVQKFCYFVDFHDIVHHNLEINKKWYNIILEFINNFLSQGGVIILFIYLAKILDIRTIFLWTLFYSSIHNINYNIVFPKTHQEHHKNKNTNYGIDIFDILFNTKYDNDVLENYNHGAINIIILTLLLCYIY